MVVDVVTVFPAYPAPSSRPSPICVSLSKWPACHPSLHVRSWAPVPPGVRQTWAADGLCPPIHWAPSRGQCSTITARPQGCTGDSGSPPGPQTLVLLGDVAGSHMDNPLLCVY